MNLFSDLIQHIQNLYTNLSDAQRDQINKLLAEGTIHQSNCWGAHMTPPVNHAALLGHILAAGHNGNLLSAHLYPVLSAIESEILDWFCQKFQQPYGHVIHGGSYANLEALWQAKEHYKDLSTIVYASQDAHYSIAKACRILDLQYQTITTDDDGIMCLEQLTQRCRQAPPLAIVATAGTSSCGAIDPLRACAEIAHDVNSWLHIDAAWGGMLTFLDTSETELSFSVADSVCFDPHKALELAKPCSILMYQHPLDTFNEIEIDYLHTAPKLSLSGSYGGELFLPLWCCLFNENELISHIRQRLLQATLFSDQLIQHTDWKVWQSATGIICFKPTKEVDLSHLEQRGMLSRAKIHSHAVYRVVFASHYTKAEQILTALSPYF